MTVIQDRLNRAWTSATSDFVVTDTERANIVQANMVEIARNPRDSKAAAYSVLRDAQARLDAATSATSMGLSPPRGRTVNARRPHPTTDAQVRLLTAARDQARALVGQIESIADTAISELRERMGNLRALSGEIWLNDEEETTVINILNSTPEHMRPALAEAIRRDPSMFGDLRWRLFGSESTAYHAWMDRYAPR